MGLSYTKPGSASSTKLTLAEKRYRVNGSNGISFRRKSTRKTGNVTTTGCDMLPLARRMEFSPSLRSLENMVTGGEIIELAEVLPCSKIDTRLMALYPQYAQPKSVSSVSAANLANQNAANTILLTRTQRVLIENSWKRSRKTGAESVGARIFVSVLTSQPDIKLLFGLEKIPRGRLKYDPRFRKHAALLTKTFDYIVKNLAYTEKLCQHFQALGKKHCQLQGRVFQQNYWDAFSECITQSAIEESGYRCRETTIAWRNLVAFIIKQMRKGFDEEKALRKRFSASLVAIASRASTASIPPNNRGSSNPLVPTSFKNEGDFRISSLSSLHVHSTGYNRQRTSSMNSTVSAATVCVAGATSLTPNMAVAKESARSASWCSEQQEFEAQFTRMALSTGEVCTSNPSFTFGYDNSGKRRGSTYDEYYTPPSSTKHMRAQPAAMYFTHTHSTPTNNQLANEGAETVLEGEEIQLRVYDENGSLATSTPTNHSQPPYGEKTFFSFDNLVNSKKCGSRKDAGSQLPPLPSLPRHSFSTATSNDFVTGNSSKNDQLAVDNNYENIRRLSAL